MEATIRQMQLITTLCKELEIVEPIKILSKEEADAYIKRLIAIANNGTPQKAEGNLNKEYPISFQAFVKAACKLYSGRPDKSFKDIIKEVQEVY